VRQRFRAQVELDRDEVGPTTIDVAQAYLTENIEWQGDQAKRAIDWETFRTYIKAKRETIVLVAWAKVVK